MAIMILILMSAYVSHVNIIIPDVDFNEANDPDVCDDDVNDSVNDDVHVGMVKGVHAMISVIAMMMLLRVMLVKMMAMMVLITMMLLMTMMMMLMLMMITAVYYKKSIKSLLKILNSW